nr:flagellar filament capping protein FliD [Roseburia sp. MSJ-14]
MTALNVLGIDRIVEPSQNAEFLLDGKERSSFTNTFSINNAFELTLHSISEEGNPATIGFKANVDAIADNIQTLVDSYNDIIETSDKYSESQPQSALLYHDMSSAAFTLQNDLEAVGLMVESNGEIYVDKALLADAVDTEHPDESFSVLNDFKNLLDKKATTASLDPMKYVDKIIVVYKNPNKTLVTPYITSIYSGMMMDRYC